VIVVIIPVYNVGGMLNRNSFSRANQNGPKEHGFRGNAKNLDLNRDFIKLDSRNAKTFTKIFRAWDPDIFIDTHTTNGSDHQYTLTLIASQKDKLNPFLSSYMKDKMLPDFYADMKRKKMEMVPYVYSMRKTPEMGIKAFLETPRYSSGYAALFDCFSFITEAHVFKSFENRVIHTRGFLETVIDFAGANSNAIKIKRKEAKKHILTQEKFPIKWSLDTTKLDKWDFKGYESELRKSQVTGQEMTFYNSKKAFQKKIPFYNSYLAEVEVKKPKSYIVPKAYDEVIKRLDWNQVKLNRLKKDSIIEVSVYYILDYKSPPQPYEAHYLHSNIKVRKKVELHQFYRGDIIVPTDQEAVRYIVETLEPESVDGFFAWNFFDGILQQKEWFSDYAFEPIAKELLNKDFALKKDFEAKKREDEKFASSSWEQLYYIYKRSPYFEKTLNRYPVYRID